jgi:hypothetical protein
VDGAADDAVPDGAAPDAAADGAPTDGDAGVLPHAEAMIAVTAINDPIRIRNMVSSSWIEQIGRSRYDPSMILMRRTPQVGLDVPR